MEVEADEHGFLKKRRGRPPRVKPEENKVIELEDKKEELNIGLRSQMEKEEPKEENEEPEEKINLSVIMDEIERIKNTINLQNKLIATQKNRVNNVYRTNINNLLENIKRGIKAIVSCKEKLENVIDENHQFINYDFNIHLSKDGYHGTCMIAKERIVSNENMIAQACAFIEDSRMALNNLTNQIQKFNELRYEDNEV